MKKRKTRISKLLAMMLAMALAITTFTLPVFAANTPVNGPASVTFDKYLVLDKTANVPNATFTFKVEAGTASSQDGQPILAGVDADKVTVGNAVFAPADSTYDTVQSGDTIVLGNDKKYAAKPVTVDFSKVSFTAPGIYRYTITENSATVPGVTQDSNTYNLDIAVTTDDSGILSINTTNGVGMNNGTVKVTGFVNTFGSTDLTLKKIVTGNQGDRNKYFEFDVAIKGAPAGAKYNVVLPATEAYTPADPSTITVGTDGTVTASYHLKHNQSITIQGMTEGTKYTITEKINDNEGYTVSHVVNSGTKADQKVTAEQTMDDTSDTVTYTNNRAGIIPTGILLDIAPYVLMVTLTGIAFIALTVNKKRRMKR